MTPALLMVAAYVAGALPIGLLVAKWWKGIDVREHGSGNIGATNVFRVVGKTAGSIVFLLDVLKGLWPPLAAQRLGLDPWWQVAAGLAAVLGHSFSPLLGFKGGKGIATSLGVLFGVAWKVGLASWALWIVAVLATRYVSVGSILAAASLTPFSLLFYPGDLARLTFALVAGGSAIYKHRANIDRLRKGTENRFGRKDPPASEEPDREEQE